MSTAYQQRLKMLWEGNPLANFRIPEQEDTAAPLPPATDWRARAAVSAG